MKCPIHHNTDPFQEARNKDGVLVNEYQGVAIPLILRHADVREAARDWQTFSSDAPFKVPIPNEEEVRSVRQLPLEVDPPAHTLYRQIADPFFIRPRLPEVVERMEKLMEELVRDALEKSSFEAVKEFAIPLQSRALAILTDMPDSEAEVWIGWGTHVFRDGDGTSKGAALETYINQLLDDGEASQGNDFFS